jgi:hypothetical protein
MGEGTASMIEETLLKGLSPGLVHRSRTNVKGESRAVARPNYTDRKHHQMREGYCQLKLT